MGSVTETVLPEEQLSGSKLLHEPGFDAIREKIVPRMDMGVRYRIGAKLGEHDEPVWMARDEKMGREVVVKGEVGKKIVKGIMYEAVIGANLNHPNIATVHDLAVDGNGKIYYVMEYLSGGDMKQWMKTPRSWQEKVRVLEEVAAGIDYLHGMGFVYGDLRAENIVFGEQGQVKVVDFGSLSEVDDQGMAPVIYGTPLLAAPEQDETQVKQTDFYQLTEVIVMMIVNKTDYWEIYDIVTKLRDERAKVDDFVTGSQLEDSIVDEINSLICQGLDKNPLNRGDTARGLVKQFKELLVRAEVIEKRNSLEYLIPDGK